MFTGFATENAPGVQVWDYSNTQATSGSATRIALAADCAPVQIVKTGGTTTSIILTLPAAPFDGKRILVVNALYNINTAYITIQAPDVANGASANFFSLGPGAYLDLCYSRSFVSNSNFGPSSTGWYILNMAASGAQNYYSVACGQSNYASASYSSALGGRLNSATGSYSSVFGGYASLANNGFAVVAGGFSNTASGGYSSVLGGQVNSASGPSSSVLSGDYGTTRGINGMTVFAASVSPVAAIQGATQAGMLILGRQTTDATTTTLASNASVVASTNQLNIANNSAAYFRGSVVANVTGTGDAKAWSFEGLIKAGATAATTTIVQSVINVVASTTGAAAWAISVLADTTNQALQVQVTGAAATTIRWVCKIETTEVSF